MLRAGTNDALDVVTRLEDHRVELTGYCYRMLGSPSMPPYALWFRGSDQVRAFMLGTGAQCRGSRVVPTVANGTSAYGQYKPSGPGGRHEPWALVVLEVSAGRVAAINASRHRPAVPALRPARGARPSINPGSGRQRDIDALIVE